MDELLERVVEQGKKVRYLVESLGLEDEQRKRLYEAIEKKKICFVSIPRDKADELERETEELHQRYNRAYVDARSGPALPEWMSDPVWELECEWRKLFKK